MRLHEATRRRQGLLGQHGQCAGGGGVAQGAEGAKTRRSGSHVGVAVGHGARGGEVVQAGEAVCPVE